MGLRDAAGAIGDNVKGLLTDPAGQFKRAGKVIVDHIQNEGQTGVAAKSLSGRGKRIDDAVDDSVNDPTHVHYGGNPGSSVRRSDD